MFFQYTDRKIQDYTIKRCRSNNIHFTDGYTPFDSLPTNIRITESVFSSTDGSGSSGISFSKNLIAFNVNNFVSSDFFNNTFLYTSNSLNGITYSNIRNNIFLTSHVFNSNTSCTNSFSNNLKINGCGLLCGCPFNTGVEAGTISVSSTNDIFISYVGSFPYIDNYHLKPTCPGVNAGTDGTDVGIYGTSQPTSEGWVPSNPHIYFKQVAPQTNSNGQLPIQFKVRTGN